MPKFEKPAARNADDPYELDSLLEEGYTVIKVEYNIFGECFAEDDEYGRSVFHREEYLYGPYETEEEAQDHADYLNSIRGQRPVLVRRRRLIERVIKQQSWIP